MERPAGTTGLGMVGRLVLGRLAALPGRDICCLGWYYDGEPYDEAVFPYRILPQGGGRTPQDNLPRALSASGGGVVVTMGDPWSFEWVADLREQRDFAWIAYLTIDSRPRPWGI